MEFTFSDKQNKIIIQREKLKDIPFFKILFATSLQSDKNEFKISNINIILPLIDFLNEGKLNWYKYNPLDYFVQSCDYMSLWMMSDNIYMAQLHYLCKCDLQFDLNQISNLYLIFSSRQINNEHYQNNLKWITKYLISIVNKNIDTDLPDNLLLLLSVKKQIRYLVKNKRFDKMLNYNVYLIVNTLLKSDFNHYYSSLFRRHLKRDASISWFKPDITKNSSLIIKSLNPFKAEVYTNIGRITNIKNNIYTVKLEIDIKLKDDIFDGNHNFIISNIKYKNENLDIGYSFGIYEITIFDKLKQSSKLFKVEIIN